MDSTNLRRKDTTKGPPLRILSLDGGGVRGYSMLVILQVLMYRTYVECEGKPPRRDQVPKPCEHFDLIAGSGTGGLIALMLGRLRMDIETCKDIYVRMTRRVFETDKTFAGIPYRSTLFKASKLEEAIRECVREHTISEAEGNDGTLPPRRVYAPRRSSLMSPSTPSLGGAQKRSNRHSVASMDTPPSSAPGQRDTVGGLSPSLRWGNPEAYLYDNREFRTKTAVTAVYKGTPKGGNSILLRSYDSRREPPPESNCTIWQAGRATSATGLAFKPIRIGQHFFHDEGAGKFNPSPQILDEATVNEWPGREVGVFVSIGTGKRPAGAGNQQQWWEEFFADALGEFAEARKRLIAKIEDCEKTHQAMLKEHLAKRNVPKDNYYRLNVEVGVGEFGMNEWNRLAEISTNTRSYLARADVQKMTQDAAAKLARIKRQYERVEARDTMPAVEDEIQQTPPQSRPISSHSQQAPPASTLAPPPPQPPRPHPSETSDNPVFELPAEMPPSTGANPRPPPPLPDRRPDGHDKFTVLSEDVPAPLRVPRTSIDKANRNSLGHQSPYSGGSPRTSSELDASPGSGIPPPRPPKTPIPYPENGSNVNTRLQSLPNGAGSVGGGVVQMPVPPRNADRPIITVADYGNVNGSGGTGAGTGRKFELPYPDDGPPPLVNKRRKPTYVPRSS